MVGTRRSLGARNPDGTFLDYGHWPGPTHFSWADAIDSLKEGFSALGGGVPVFSGGGWGYSARRGGKSSAVSSHSSGTAVDLSAPLGGTTKAMLVINEMQVERLREFGVSMKDIAQVFEVYGKVQSSKPTEAAATTPVPPRRVKHVGPRPARQFDHYGRRRF
jgi:hypothetical protein